MFVMKNLLQFIGLDALNAWAKNNAQYLPNGGIEVGNYDRQRYEEAQTKYKGLVIPEFSELVLVIQVRAKFCLTAEMKEEFEYYYVDRAHPALKIENEIIVPTGNYNAKTFSFYLLNSITHKYANNLSEFEREGWPESPNKVGKATRKSLQAWVDYLLEIEMKKQEIINEKTQEVDEFLVSLKPYEALIKWDKDKTTGNIVRGGLRYEFSIDNTGYISQKWEKHYMSGNTLEIFMKASENKLL